MLVLWKKIAVMYVMELFHLERFIFVGVDSKLKVHLEILFIVFGGIIMGSKEKPKYLTDYRDRCPKTGHAIAVRLCKDDCPHCRHVIEVDKSDRPHKITIRCNYGK